MARQERLIEFALDKLSGEKLVLNEEARNELKADIDTIESQINSPKPKHSIIREGIKSVRNILEGAAGSVLAAELLKMLFKLGS